MNNYKAIVLDQVKKNGAKAVLYASESSGAQISTTLFESPAYAYSLPLDADVLKALMRNQLDLQLGAFFQWACRYFSQSKGPNAAKKQKVSCQ